ncbi:hypothetical protein CHLNCDRAFT_137656 [Chlorella variabilis]|uniref:SAYSvFN domain-containing protein n=1 Tax=Chlorella variabilis TaxID=554065 RepID=E1Z471_CHLVA|nr:hypothetical protein CHLNCDRAFT_137656 [Chlorella variabilis]EFN59004.1 hypothetical protein CHLNCDRAFT_137656 [Chlorella variabilis]|eukprot:XP_005851106.1 hypothetical protein CHLNCDRAFT_137656 [Chlorella variabilis]
MQLTVVTAAGKRLSVQLPPEQQLTAAALQAAVARSLALPPGAGLRLVQGGQLLAGDEAVGRLQDGDTLLAAVVPRPPPKAVRDLVSGGGPEEEEEDEADQMLRLRLPANAPRWKRAAAHLLHRRLRLPEALVALLLAVRPRFWLGLLAWMGGARLAAGHELGPLYIITTIFLLMLLNLGQRKEGEWSAYSIFNRNTQRLPGQMTAEDLDAAVRRGQL